MLSATQKKLREAKFFLSRLEQEERLPPGSSIPEAADFYFSAFVSAARSVAFVFQKENKAEYDSWAPGWFQSRSGPEELLMKRFKQERTQALKLTGSDLAGDTVLVPTTRIPGANSPLSTQLIWWGESIPEIATTGLRCRFAYDNADVAVVPAAREYVELLGQLVRDFLASHADGSLTNACS